MSHTRIRSSTRLFEGLARLYPLLVLSMLPLGVLVAFGLGQPSLARSGMLIFGPAVLGAVAIVYRVQHSTGRPRAFTVSTDTTEIQMVFVTVFAASVVVLSLVRYRPWYYFVLLALLYALVLVQIIGDASVSAVIVQLVALMAGWVYGLTLKYAFYFGGTSTLVHRFYAELTLRSGSTIPAELSMDAHFPLYHTFAAGSAELLGLSVETVLMAVVPLPFFATIVLVYKLFSGITGDEQVGLLTALLYTLQPIVLYYAPYMITRTMAFVGFLTLLYVAYSRHRFTTPQYAFLLVFFSLFTTLVHHVSTPQIVSLLVLLSLCEYLLTGRLFAVYPLVTLVTIASAYWAMFAQRVIQTLSSVYTKSDHYDEAEVVSSTTDQSLNHFTYYLNNYLLIFLLLVGIGVLLWRYRDRFEVVFGIFALATLALYVPSPIHALSQTLHLFRMDRYILLLSPFAAFVMAIGALGTCNCFRGRFNGRAMRGTVLIALVCLLVLSSATVSGIASNAADSEDLSWTGPPMHFTDSEMDGVEFVTTNVPSENRVTGDWQTMRYFRPMAYDFPGADRHDIPIYQQSVARSGDGLGEKEGYFVLRKQQLENGGVLFGGQGMGQRALYQDEQTLYQQFRTKNQVYDNDEVEIHHTPEAES